MGSTAQVLVVGPHAERLVEVARERLAELENRWSRFRPDSEISRLNNAAGAALTVSADTVLLVSRAVLGWRRTAGRFDPTVHAAMIANGYDRDFALVAAADRVAGPVDPLPAPGCASIHVDLAGSRVRLPAGVAIDPGGIGKGLAADLVATELRRAGATSVLVNVGGDLRAAGAPPDSEGWPVSVADPVAPEQELLRVAMPAGAVASSSTVERRWRSGESHRHHVIDPRTGTPTDTPVIAATVFAATAWWAEVLTKAILVGGDTDLSELPDGVEAIAVTAAGTRHVTAGVKEVVLW
jgi:FAD:protein FMN transferase